MTDLGKSFDASADDYVRARATYPESMIDDIVERAGLSPASRILEVGCGSGQATLAFAARGYSIVAIDPAERALAHLSERCRNFPDVHLVHTTLEAFQPGNAFDLILCAQSFHWLDPQTVGSRFAHLLAPAGRIALFWHMQDIAPDGPEADLYRLNGHFFGDFPRMNPPEYGREFLDAMSNILCRSDEVGRVRISEYPWRQHYDRSMFASLAHSWSKYATLSASDKRRYDNDLADYLDALAGDPEIKYRTCLIEAEKRQ
ncbi:MAG: class I SAM-dependent methyltransferase [Pseudomonadales bacterium]|nr:class I SAM-dependent methyltransferase [Pseudomonadales bacterium]